MDIFFYFFIYKFLIGTSIAITSATILRIKQSSEQTSDLIVQYFTHNFALCKQLHMDICNHA